MGKPTIEQIKQIVAVDNPKLMILTDDVYGTFVPAFRSLFTELPYNTACIYSYSKYFGATGWRVGTIAVSQENIFDQLLKSQWLENGITGTLCYIECRHKPN